ncbi:hypothetical protein HF576_16470 [Microbacterium sp. CFH 90308]|uniref:Uncharacterized protein n=1 Tax=Microbacterium salsuginis TaxID=2722803 RepID=A0ABX1KGN6_9MICO|nr:hypothetical protein [Microbacterium sp. CFH 90308]NLP85443.1 hypothetical protein [Microbacterium sp. CFH 90308]
MPEIEYKDVADRLADINQRILSANPRANLFFTMDDSQRWPHWYWTLLTQIHVAAGDSQIVYLTSSLADDASERDEVIAFTGKAVVHALVTDVAKGDSGAQVRTDLWRRRELESMSILHVDPLPSRNTGHPVRFPRGLSLELRYGDRPTLTVPLTRWSDAEGNDAVGELLEGVRGDLAR